MSERQASRRARPESARMWTGTHSVRPSGLDRHLPECCPTLDRHRRDQRLAWPELGQAPSPRVWTGTCACVELGQALARVWTGTDAAANWDRHGSRLELGQARFQRGRGKPGHIGDRLGSRPWESPCRRGLGRGAVELGSGRGRTSASPAPVAPQRRGRRLVVQNGPPDPTSARRRNPEPPSRRRTDWHQTCLSSREPLPQGRVRQPPRAALSPASESV